MLSTLVNCLLPGMCLPRNKISVEQEPALPVGTQSWYSRDEALAGFVARRCLCNEEGVGFAGGKMGRSIFVLGYQRCCRGQAKGVLEIRKRTYAKGFSTARQGCLQVTGSY